jgi:hypothetical protein
MGDSRNVYAWIVLERGSEEKKKLNRWKEC